MKKKVDRAPTTPPSEAAVVATAEVALPPMTTLTLLGDELHLLQDFLPDTVPSFVIADLTNIETAFNRIPLVERRARRREQVQQLLYFLRNNRQAYIAQRLQQIKSSHERYNRQAGMEAYAKLYEGQVAEWTATQVQLQKLIETMTRSIGVETVGGSRREKAKKVSETLAQRRVEIAAMDETAATDTFYRMMEQSGLLTESLARNETGERYPRELVEAYFPDYVRNQLADLGANAWRRVKEWWAERDPKVNLTRVTLEKLFRQANAESEDKIFHHMPGENNLLLRLKMVVEELAKSDGRSKIPPGDLSNLRVFVHTLRDENQFSNFLYLERVDGTQMQKPPLNSAFELQTGEGDLVTKFRTALGKLDSLPRANGQRESNSEVMRNFLRDYGHKLMLVVAEPGGEAGAVPAPVSPVEVETSEEPKPAEVLLTGRGVNDYLLIIGADMAEVTVAGDADTGVDIGVARNRIQASIDEGKNSRDKAALLRLIFEVSQIPKASSHDADRALLRRYFDKYYPPQTTPIPS